MPSEPNAASVSLGAAVRDLRKRAGLSQEELSARAGLYRNTSGLLERAENDATLKTIRAVADALGVTLVELFALAAEYEAAGGDAGG